MRSKSLNVNKMKMQADLNCNFTATLEEYIEPTVLHSQDAETAWGAICVPYMYIHGVPLAYLQAAQKLDWFDDNCDKIIEWPENTCCAYRAPHQRQRKMH